MLNGTRNVSLKKVDISYSQVWVGYREARERRKENPAV